MRPSSRGGADRVEVLPDRLGDERNHRVHEAQGWSRVAARIWRLELCEGRLQLGLDRLNVPIAQVAPEKVVAGLGVESKR